MPSHVARINVVSVRIDTVTLHFFTLRLFCTRVEAKDRSHAGRRES